MLTTLCRAVILISRGQTKAFHEVAINCMVACELITFTAFDFGLIFARRWRIVGKACTDALLTDHAESACVAAFITIVLVCCGIDAFSLAYLVVGTFLPTALRRAHCRMQCQPLLLGVGSHNVQGMASARLVTTKHAKTAARSSILQMDRQCTLCPRRSVLYLSS